MESRGNRNYPLGGINNVASTLHWGVHYTMNRYNMTRAEAILEDGTTFADDFHTYGKGMRRSNLLGSLFTRHIRIGME